MAAGVTFDGLWAKIALCQQHFEFENAQFLAERLHAHVDNVESLLLLATACFQNGNRLQTWALLRHAHPDCRRRGKVAFLLAKVCVRVCECCGGCLGPCACICGCLSVSVRLRVRVSVRVCTYAQSAPYRSPRLSRVCASLAVGALGSAALPCASSARPSKRCCSPGRAPTPATPCLASARPPLFPSRPPAALQGALSGKKLSWSTSGSVRRVCLRFVRYLSVAVAVAVLWCVLRSPLRQHPTARALPPPRPAAAVAARPSSFVDRATRLGPASGGGPVLRGTRRGPRPPAAGARVPQDGRPRQSSHAFPTLPPP